MTLLLFWPFISRLLQSKTADDVLFQAGMVGAFIIFSLGWTVIWLRYQQTRNQSMAEERQAIISDQKAERRQRDADWREFFAEERRARADMMHSIGADLSRSLDGLSSEIKASRNQISALTDVVVEHDARTTAAVSKIVQAKTITFESKGEE